MGSQKEIVRFQFTATGEREKTVNRITLSALACVLSASTSIAQSGIVSDDFSGATLGSQWTHVDPLDDTTLAPEGFGTEDARMVLSIPEGPNHDLWANANDAPRLLQDCNDVNFELEAKWDSLPTQGWTAQGMLVHESADRLLVFQILHRPDGNYLFGAHLNGSSAQVLINEFLGEVAPSYLRVERSGQNGDGWTASYSYDGSSWSSSSLLIIDLRPTQVGVHALSNFVGNGVAPAFVSKVDYFFDTANRIDPEDGLVDIEPPTASAGDDQSIHVGQLVDLDGSGSTDDVTANEDLTFSWAFVSQPSGSTATLSSANSVAPSFTPDAIGVYVLELTVADLAGFTSTDVVEVSCLNLPPTAAAGSDELISVGAEVILDGLDSSDPDQDSITYAWSFTSLPPGSQAILVDADTATPSFSADVAGDYIVELITSDGYSNSMPDELTVSAIQATDIATQKLRDLARDLRWEPASKFVRRYHKRWMRRQLRITAWTIEANYLQCAEWRLNRLLRRTDGCVLRGSPDAFCWSWWWSARPDVVIDCELQEVIYTTTLCALDLIDLGS